MVVLRINQILIILMIGFAFTFVANHSLAIPSVNTSQGIKLKNICRVIGIRENQLTGYGIVTGLSGTGDSSRNKVTIQSIANTLQKFNVRLNPKDIYSRNVAAVIVTANLPAFAQPGDKIDVTVSSSGDARSLQGGTLMRMHLTGANGKIYALAQGPVAVGGYQYRLNSNLEQKNHPTTGLIPNGAIIEAKVPTEFVKSDGSLMLKLYSPDFTTSKRVVNIINSSFGYRVATAKDAGNIKVTIPQSYREDVVTFVSRLESLSVKPDMKAKVVINERSGSVVTGGDVKISAVNITHGDLKVKIVTDFFVSQPEHLIKPGSNVRTAIVPETSIKANESKPMNVSFNSTTTVSKLVSALTRVRASTRDIITILQSIKQAGALHAELVIQ